MPDAGKTPAPPTDDVERLRARVAELEQRLAQANARREAEERVQEWNDLVTDHALAGTDDGDESRRRVMDVLESMSDAFFALDSQRRVTYLNTHAEQLLALTRQELIGRVLCDALPAMAGTTFAHMCTRAMRERVALTFEEFFSPYERWYEARLYPTGDGLSVFFRDVTDRRQAEERLHFQASMLDQVNDAVVGLDSGQSVNYWNRYAETMLGIPAAEAMGQPLAALFAMRWYTPAEESAVATALLATGTWRGEVSIVTRHGQEIIIEASTSAVKDMHGVRNGWLTILRDVTERRRIEDALRTSTAQLQQLIDNSSAAIYIKDTAGRLLFVNSPCARIFRMRPEEMIGKTDRAVMPGDMADVFRATDQRILASGVTEEIEEVVEQDDGPHTYISAKFPLRDANGHIYALCGISTDITARKRVEEVLQQSVTALRHVVLNAPFPIAVHAEDGEILYLSKAWSALTGYAPEEIPTIAAWTERAYGPDAAAVQAEIQQIYADNPTVQEREYTITTAGGEKRIWNISRAGLGKMADGRRLAVTIAVDVTERSRLYHDTQKALEAQQALNELKDLFLSTVSHELRTPLAAIRGYTQILQRTRKKRGDVSDRDDALLASIVQHTNRMNKLVGDIFDMSQLQTGEFTLTRTPDIDLAALLQRVVVQAQVTSPERDFTCETVGQPVMATVDAERIEQVLHNLIANAVKYSQKEAIIATGISVPTPSEAILWVRDYGRGIDPEEQRHVFNRFHRAQTNPGVEGLGLGLYISHEIITRHGGRMWLDSTVGTGSTFYVALPLEQN